MIRIDRIFTDQLPNIHPTAAEKLQKEKHVFSVDAVVFDKDASNQNSGNEKQEAAENKEEEPEAERKAAQETTEKQGTLAKKIDIIA